MNAPEHVPSRKRFARHVVVVAALLVALGSGYAFWQHVKPPQYLHAPEADFVALFAAPPAADSAQTRGELDELLALQQRRTRQQADAANADRKTEIWQFASALGLPPDQVRKMVALNSLAQQVEDDVRPYVRAAKHRFLRLRPYEIEPRISPCIDDVRGDLSYPSGHSTFGYVMAYLLSDMVPERRAQLTARAQEFAQQRAVCGVHFPSDLEAGRIGAEWLVQRFLASPEYRAASAAARAELRAAVGL
jgi:acid phosphatase (class A)